MRDVLTINICFTKWYNSISKNTSRKKYTDNSILVPVTLSQASIRNIVWSIVSNDLLPVRTGTNSLLERFGGKGLGELPLTLKMRRICICFLLRDPVTKSSVSLARTSTSPVYVKKKNTVSVCLDVSNSI